MSKINLEIGEQPKLEWVEIGLINADHNYQREIKPRLVAKILQGFRWDHFGAVVLAPQEGGGYHVTDGQHRVKAASLHPTITQVPAMIITGFGLETEASNFLAINQDRQAVSPIDRYWAGVTAGDETYLRISRVLKTAGCDVVPRQGEKGANLTSSVYALKRSINSHGETAVTGALLCIREAWPKQKDALRGVLIGGIARLLGEHKSLDQDRLVDVLVGQRYSVIAADAETMRKMSGGSAELNIARSVAYLYNHGLAKKLQVQAGAK